MNGKITKLNNLPEGTDEKSLIEQWNNRSSTPEIAGVDDAAIEVANEDEITKTDLDAKMKSKYEAKRYKSEQNKLAMSKLGTNIGKYGTIAGNIAG